MNKIKVKLEDYKIIIEFLNNYFIDDFFINVVDESKLVKKFTNARYDTKKQCNDYFNMWFDTFEDSCDDEYDFQALYNQVLCNCFSNRIKEQGEYYIEELNTTMYYFDEIV